MRVDDVLLSVEMFFKENRDKFVKWNSKNVNFENVYGFEKDDKFYVFMNRIQDLFRDLPKKFFLKTCVDHGFLIKDKQGRNTNSVYFPSVGVMRFYVFSKNVLCEQEEDCCCKILITGNKDLKKSIIDFLENVKVRVDALRIFESSLENLYLNKGEYDLVPFIVFNINKSLEYILNEISLLKEVVT